MAVQAQARSRPRVRLSTERVLRAAIPIADKRGIEALTMRNLAEELGVEAMTLYYYVAKKDEIVNGILDLVVDEIDVPSSGGDWKTALRRSAISAHEVLLRHPWACSLMMSPARIGPARLRYMESLLGRLREAGFSANMTHHAYHALDSHILGFTMWEVGYSAGARALPDLGAAFRRQFPVDRYPYIAEHMGEHSKKSSRADGEFGFGLDLILDGLEEIRTTRPGSRARTDTPRARPRRHPNC